MNAVLLKSTRDVLLVFAVLALTYAYFYQDPSWNGNSRMGLTFAIVREGRLTIDSFYAKSGTKTGDKSFYDGHYYTDKAIGTSLLGALVYLPMYVLEQVRGYELNLGLVKHLLTLFTIGLPAALAGCLIYLVCRSIVASRPLAYVATIGVALGTMALPYGIVFYG